MRMTTRLEEFRSGWTRRRRKWGGGSAAVPAAGVLGQPFHQWAHVLRHNRDQTTTVGPERTTAILASLVRDDIPAQLEPGAWPTLTADPFEMRVLQCRLMRGHGQAVRARVGSRFSNRKTRSTPHPRQGTGVMRWQWILSPAPRIDGESRMPQFCTISRPEGQCSDLHLHSAAAAVIGLAPPRSQASRTLGALSNGLPGLARHRTPVAAFQRNIPQRPRNSRISHGGGDPIWPVPEPPPAHSQAVWAAAP